MPKGSKRREDLTGMRFGMLTAMKSTGVDKWGHTIWLCKCDCGNICESTAPVLKNGDKTDNRAENLEWCTYSQNTRHAIGSGLITDPARNFDMTGKHGKDHPTSKPVEQYDLEGNFIAEYESGIEAGKALGVSGGSIQRCAAGKRKTAFGYRWKYKGVEWRYEYDGRP